MRNLFYSLLIILIFAASLLAVTLILRSRDLEITVIDPVHTEKKETKAVQPQTEEKKIVSDISAPAAEIERSVEKIDRKISSEHVVSETSVKADETEKIVPAPSEKTEKTEKIKKAADTKKVEKQQETETVISDTEVQKKVSAAETVEKKSVSEPEKVIDVPQYKCGWIEEFEPDGHLNGIKYADNWKLEGGIIFTPKTSFYLKKDPGANDGNLLVIESRKSSAVFACDLSGIIDLNKTPILRWRWKVKKLPPFGDGRHRKRDDQAVGIYIGSGTAFNQKAISYRWETETPINHWGKTVYSNVMNVWFYCMRNKNSGLNVWYEETRDVRQDFLDKYGYVPEKIALVICGNSQNSKSDALAEIDHIGFYKEVKEKEKNEN